MIDNRLVSIIIVFLNSEQFIEETIDSVFAQTYPDWELLLIDDGSEDLSTKIARDYAEKYPQKIRYYDHLNHINRGISASRNLGLRNAKGKYVATLDSDDIWVPEKLQEQVSILDSYPDAMMVFGDTRYWYSWEESNHDKDLDYNIQSELKPETLNLDSVIHPPSLLKLVLSGAVISASMSNIMFRNNLIEKVGLFEEKFTGMHEDMAFLAKVYLDSPIYISTKCWDLYRIHKHSCFSLAKQEGKVLSSELFFLDWLEEYITKKRVKDKDLISTLNRRKWNYKHPKLRRILRIARGVKKKILT